MINGWQDIGDNPNSPNKASAPRVRMINGYDEVINLQDGCVHQLAECGLGQGSHAIRVNANLREYNEI
jgi:hypothetical protein